MYYQGNGIYKYLRKHNLCDRYFWTSGSMWTLLYSKENGEPAVLCFASRVNKKEELTQPATEEERDAFRRFCILARQANLPLFSLRFVDDGVRACEHFWFRIYRSGEPARVISSAQLLNWLAECGLKLWGETAEKDVNDRVSSSFHIWQREHMGKGVIATDLDLLCMDGDRVDTIYELKRSYISLDEWEPFEKDRVNYLAGLRLAVRAKANYRIVYNVRHTKPKFFDDVSQLKVFSMDNEWPPSALGEYAIEDYFPVHQGGATT